MYASGVYESTSGQFVRIDDISITGTVGKNEITVPAKAAFAETDIVDFSSDIGEKNAVGGCLLECIYITAQDKDGKEFQVDLHPGDKVKVLSADFPVFEFK
ncbi:MAG: hypothetical protein IJ930_00640 [Lachnospiraceae bacterium]|nr:hypothetical protein [Lachnospiraceae bacterium]